MHHQITHKQPSTTVSCTSLQATTTYKGPPPAPQHIESSKHTTSSRDSNLQGCDNVPSSIEDHSVPVDVQGSYSDSELSDQFQQEESSPNLPTPDSDVADDHPPSPLKYFKSYSHLISCIAKVLQLAVVQPPPQETDRVYEDINQDQSPPLQLALIYLIRLIRESWGTHS